MIEIIELLMDLLGLRERKREQEKRKRDDVWLPSS
jgi:hypothetical protein